MKKKSRLFTGFSRRMPACLVLGTAEATVYLYRRRGLKRWEATGHGFRAPNLPGLLAEVKSFALARGVERLTVLLHHSLLLDRHLFLPFAGRRAVSLVLPGELAPLVPGSLADYRYGFTIPPRRQQPVSVFLLPPVVGEEIRRGLGRLAGRLVPLDLACAGHPAARAEAALLFTRDDRDGRLMFFQHGRFVAARTCRLEGSDAQPPVSERRIFAHGMRLDEALLQAPPVEVKIGEDVLLPRPRKLPAFSFRAAAEPAFLRADILVPAGVLLAMLLLGFTVRHVRHARAEALGRRDAAAVRLAQLRAGMAFDDEYLLSVLSNPSVTRLLDREVSPLAGFARFSTAIPGDLPLTLEYYEADRDRLTVTARLDSPQQIDRLIRVLVETGFFHSPRLGELKVEENAVRFPLTMRVVGAPEAGTGGGR